MVKNNRKLVLAIILALCLLQSTSPAAGFITVRLCGRKLVNVIRHLCDFGETGDHHQTALIHRRAEMNSMLENEDIQDDLVESCCRKQCTYSYLKMYCNADTTMILHMKRSGGGGGGTKNVDVPKSDTLTKSQSQSLQQNRPSWKRRHEYKKHRNGGLGAVRGGGGGDQDQKLDLAATDR